MIRVNKPVQAPKVLRERAAAARSAVCATYRGARAAIQRGETTLAFDRGLYAHRAVKKSLEEAHHGKCCYCESKVKHVTAGDVEHYRPKAAVQQARTAPVERPGYYWLAYEWDNLLFSCGICNGTHKRNLFPLGNPEARARSRRAKLSAEKPLLVHPAQDEPEQLIGYREEYAYAIEGDQRAELTVNQVLRLNDRPSLLERRRDHLAHVRRLQEIATMPDMPPALRAEATAWLARSVAAEAEYASMTRAALRPSSL
ncbi:hypothetical protein [Sorangium sp. So ce1153]|uniref:hypothetical protein n=1 Tax=Sorangium sp. So ce1153 TaxID=3133333 RepID=UPI003F5F06F5